MMQSVQSVHTVSVVSAGKLRPLLYPLASDRTFYDDTAGMHCHRLSTRGLDTCVRRPRPPLAALPKGQGQEPRLPAQRRRARCLVGILLHRRTARRVSGPAALSPGKSANARSRRQRLQSRKAQSAPEPGQPAHRDRPWTSDPQPTATTARPGTRSKRTAAAAACPPQVRPAALQRCRAALLCALPQQQEQARVATAQPAAMRSAGTGALPPAGAPVLRWPAQLQGPQTLNWSLMSPRPCWGARLRTRRARAPAGAAAEGQRLRAPRGLALGLVRSLRVLLWGPRQRACACSGTQGSVWCWWPKTRPWQVS